MAETKFLKATCGSCGGRIEFPADGLGLTVPCPHCGWQTELALEVPEQAAAASPRSKWVVAGVVILLVGVLGAAGSFFGARYLLEKSRAQRAVVQQPRKGRTNAVAAAKLPPRPAVVETNENGFAVSAAAVEKTAGSTLLYATGTLKNQTDKQRFGVTVELEILDSAGKAIGKARDYKDIIEPHRDWSFRAPVVNRNAAAARITGVREQP